MIDFFDFSMRSILRRSVVISVSILFAMLSACASSQRSTSQESASQPSRNAPSNASTSISSSNTAPPPAQTPPIVPATVPPILGKITLTDWRKMMGWTSAQNSAAYTPSPAFTQRIEEDVQTNDISLVVFAGSWCEDSQTELPKLFQVLESANIPADKITMFGVDENKNDPTGNAQKFGVYKVPTLIAFKKGVETGRIIEHPRTNWELDIIVIIER